MTKIKSSPEFSPKRVRVYDKRTADKIEEIKNLNNPRYDSYNTIMVEAMKFGLPYILEEVAPQNTIAKTMQSEADRIIKHINRKTELLQKNITKIMISSLLSQEILTVLLNEIEQILKKNDIVITPAIREQLGKSLPEPFATELNDLIDKFSKDEESKKN